MKSDNHDDEKLGALLRTHGLEKTSDAYADQLRDSIVAAYSKNQRESATVTSQWVVRCAAAMALLGVVLFLYHAWPLSIQPVLGISVIAFLTGLWGIILLLRRSQRIMLGA